MPALKVRALIARMIASKSGHSPVCDFGMEQMSIDAHFKSAAARRDQVKDRDLLFEFEDLDRQTDGFWLVVSDSAILDDDFGFHVRPREDSVCAHRSTARSAERRAG